DPVAATHDLIERVLDLIQRWLAEDRLADVRLILAAQGSDDPALAAVWGLVRAAQSENPGRFVLADIDDVAVLASDEPEFMLREGRVFVRRLVRAGDGLEIPAGGWRLAVLERGTLGQLRLIPAVDRPLVAGEVRVGLRASGVNFRDVLNTLGMYPGEAGELGLEGAGVVLELGPDVEGLAVGDRVMGLFPASFAPSAVTDARLLTRIPGGWSFAQAAASPVVFLTAY